MHASRGPDDFLTGEILSTPDGQTETVVRTTSVAETQGVLVYNFTVADDHTYFVEGFGSATNADGTTSKTGTLDAVWVHNDCAINLLDIRPYGDFSKYTGDELAGHEILQGSWLRAANISNLKNPALALSTPQHTLVNMAQRLAGLLDGPAAMRAMTAGENITRNMSILRAFSDTLGITDSKLNQLEAAARAFASSNGLQEIAFGCR